MISEALGAALADMLGKFGARVDEMTIDAATYDALEREVCAREMRQLGVESVFKGKPTCLRILSTTLRRGPDRCLACGQEKPRP